MPAEPDSAASRIPVIGTVARPDCYLCGTPGQIAYENLRDRLFGAPGIWNLLRCANGDCGLMWLSPMPVPEDIAMAYANYYTHAGAQADAGSDATPPRSLYRRLENAARKHYLAARYGYPSDAGLIGWLGSPLFRFEPGRRANADFSVFYLPSQPAGRLLEVGCGSGGTLAGMKFLGWDVAGLDPDPEAVKSARSRGLDITEGDLRPELFDKDSFDAVAMSHVIEHMHDPRAVLAECYRVMRPGGRIVLITPNIMSLGHRLFGRHWLHLDPPRHLHLFTRNTLSRMVLEAGFERIECTTVLREARITLAASRMIKTHGNWTFGGRAPAVTRYKSRLLEMAEWLGKFHDPDLGEEIVCLARKPSAA